MADPVTVHVDIRKWEAERKHLIQAIRLGSLTAGHELELFLRDQVKVEPHGGGGHPTPMSGAMGESVKVEIMSQSDTGARFRAGPTAPYARAIELGRRGKGGHPKYPWWRPGVEAKRQDFRSFWLRVWRDALVASLRKG